jgi:hypothetical protein
MIRENLKKYKINIDFDVQLDFKKGLGGGIFI